MPLPFQKGNSKCCVLQQGILEKPRPFHTSNINRKVRAASLSHTDTDASENPFLQALSVEQRRVVSADFSCPIIVLAGPGSGKTRVITHRIAFMISKGINPSKILAVAFSKKAADEMRQRVKSLLGNNHNADFSISVGTFHRICNQILRDFSAQACLPPSFTILDADDQFAIIKDILKSAPNTKFTHETNDLRAAISNLKIGLPIVGTFRLRTEAEELLPLYKSELARRSALDFDDLLLRTVSLLESCPAVCDALRQRWPHLLVDEFQDTNAQQYALVRLLAPPGGPGASVMVVGDVDQCIYGWRGADPSHVGRFERDYGGGGRLERLTLRDNYRSTRAIVAAAQCVIEVQPGREAKTMRCAGAAAEAKAEPVSLFAAESEEEEGDYLVREVLRLVPSLSAASRQAVVQAAAPAGGCLAAAGADAGAVAATAAEGRAMGAKAGGAAAARKAAAAAAAATTEAGVESVGVLFRTRSQSRALEEALVRAGVAYKLAGGVRFFQRKEVKDVLAYLRVVVDPSDSASLMRIVNSPPRGLGPVTVARMQAAAAASRVSCYHILAAAAGVPNALTFRSGAKGSSLSGGGGGELNGITKPQRNKLAELFWQLRSLRVAVGAIAPGGSGGGDGDEGGGGGGSSSSSSSNSSGITAAEMVLKVAEVTGLQAHLRNADHVAAAAAAAEGRDPAEAAGRWANVEELAASAQREARAGLDGLREFLQEVALLSIDQEADSTGTSNVRVHLMTIHASKGLEFDAVFLVGLHNRSLPHPLALAAGNEAEERRLAYVAFSRARRRLYLSWPARLVAREANGRIVDCLPSSFLADLPRAACRVSADSALQSDGLWEAIRKAKAAAMARAKHFSPRSDERQRGAGPG